MTPQTLAAMGAVLGPLLVFLTYALSRKAETVGKASDAMATQIASALSTTETMRTLLQPMEKEISDLRVELITLRSHIDVLERLIRDLGHNPPPMPFGRTK